MSSATRGGMRTQAIGFQAQTPLSSLLQRFPSASLKYQNFHSANYMQFFSRSCYSVPTRIRRQLPPSILLKKKTMKIKHRFSLRGTVLFTTAEETDCLNVFGLGSLTVMKCPVLAGIFSLVKSRCVRTSFTRTTPLPSGNPRPGTRPWETASRCGGFEHRQTFHGKKKKYQHKRSYPCKRQARSFLCCAISSRNLISTS